MDTQLHAICLSRDIHSGMVLLIAHWADWAKRKPILLFRLSVVFLLRFETRKFLGLLIQEPPRSTRRLTFRLMPYLRLRTNSFPVIKHVVLGAFYNNAATPHIKLKSTPSGVKTKKRLRLEKGCAKRQRAKPYRSWAKRKPRPLPR
jgi:hypothetical protein